MAATNKQIELCNLLIDNGAPFELKHPHEDSVEAADKFIKANQTYFNPTGGIALFSGHKKHPNYYKTIEQDMIDNPERWHPSDFEVPNM